MEHKHRMLVSILDRLNLEAPSSYKTSTDLFLEAEAVQHADLWLSFTFVEGQVLEFLTSYPDTDR